MTPIKIFAETSADGNKIILLADGPDEDVAYAAKLLETLTPLFSISDPPGALTCPLTWPAVVQLSAVFKGSWQVGPKLAAWIERELLARAAPSGELLTHIPPGLTPYPWQVSGALMIAAVGRMVIFDEPGCGKSVTAILGYRERAARGHSVVPIVVVCPNSVVDHWVEHFKVWAPHWSVIAWRGTAAFRKRLLGTHDVYVVSYETAVRDANNTNPRQSPLIALGATTIICDEQHMIKNPETSRSRAVRRLGKRAGHFLGLSGTPITHALTLDSPLLTPKGWKLMGEIEIGDHVIGADGQPTEVVGVYPQGVQQTFRVTFSDGATVNCTADHLWAVNSRGRRARHLPNLVLRTDELALPRSQRSVLRGLLDQGGAPRWVTPTVDPVEIASAAVPLDPYLLGTLLANGYLVSTPEITTPDTEIAEYVRAVLPEGHHLTVRPHNPLYTSTADGYRITSGKGSNKNSVTVALRNLDLLGRRAWEKFIPEVYLWNSETTRLELLRGLVDGDGTSVGSTTVYSTTSPPLAEGVKFLVRSLGGYITEIVQHRDPIVMPQGHTSPARPLHILSFGLPMNPFRLKRKAITWKPRWRTKARAITAIDQQGRVPVQCIAVKAKDGLYVTKDFVVTHNSPKNLWPALDAMAPGAWQSGERWTGRFCLTIPSEYGPAKVLGMNPYAEEEFWHCMLGQHRRVAKADVLKDLPPKVYSVRTVDLPEAYRRSYDQMESQMLAELPDGQELSVMGVLAQLTRLSQLACAAADVDVTTEIREDDFGNEIEVKHQKVTLKMPSWKIDAMLEILEERCGPGGAEDGEQVVVFAPSRQLIDLAGKAAAKEGYRVGYIKGGQSAKERTGTIARFQAGDIDVIFVVTQAGGVGITLTAARTCIFLARPWSMVDALQCEDRLHRIGAEHESIDVIDIVAKNTIDSRVRAVLKERAGALSDLLKDPRIVAELLGGKNVKRINSTKELELSNA